MSFVLQQDWCDFWWMGGVLFAFVGRLGMFLGDGVEMFMRDEVGWVSSWVMFYYSPFCSSYKWSYQLWRLRSASTSKGRFGDLQL